MIRPTVYELECFVVLAEELNFSQAARRLNLSQPPLSRQIQALEEKLGCRLFLRNTRAVSITPAGTLFLADARGLLNQLDAATEAVRRAEGGETSRLRLGFVGALLDEDLVQTLQRFRELNPRCQIHLTDLTPAPQLTALRAGNLDGAFIGAHPQALAPEFRALVWKREPLGIALPAAHPLAAAPALQLGQLCEEGWVMVSREAAPAFRQQFASWCERAKFKPRIVQESERVAAVLTMVAASQGISLLPAAVGRLIGAGVVFRKIAGRQPPSLDHTFVYRRKAVSAELLNFVALLAEFQRARKSPATPRSASRS
jgi:DNA-binding transcriptional LysR family regulator